MRLVFCGSRVWSDVDAVEAAMVKCVDRYGSFTVVHGGARGADVLAHRVALRLGLPVDVFPADWVRFGRRAGYIRNETMLSSGVDGVVAFISGASPGTRMMCEIAALAGVKVWIHSAV